MARMNWTDRAFAVFAPRAALRRVQAREALGIHKRAYAGAALGRHTDGWMTASTSADSEIYAAGGRLRDRSRDLVRNNPHAARAVSVLSNNIVGEGIMPRPKTGDSVKDKKIEKLFAEWADQCDADGQLDFYGLQTLACREMIEAGEILGRRRRRSPKDGMKVPVQIQLLEADFLDDSRSGDLATPNNNIVIQGIEIDPIGRRQAYWLWKEHPGNNFVYMRQSLMSAPVPASEIVHLYEKQRTQVRGVPWSAPVLRALRDLDDYEFSELTRKKIEACMTAFVIGDDDNEMGLNPEDPTNLDGGGLQATDSDGNPLEKMEPGLIAYLRGGKDVRMSSPATVGGYAEYKAATLRTIAAGYRVPYELLSQDLSEVNFSSIRAGIVEFRRFVKTVQWQIFIPMYLQPIWNWFCEAAYDAGQIDTPTIPVEWAPPKFDWVDPYKDALAEQLALRNGTRSFQEIAAEHGRNWRDLLDETEEWNKELDRRGITLDSDPRRTSGKGMAQKVDANGNPIPADDTADSGGDSSQN